MRTLPKEQAEMLAKQRIEDATGTKFDSLVCNGPLDAIVGATQRCVLIANGEKAGVTLTTTKIEGDKINFDAEVDDHRLPG
ncbi:DUF4333 domain-containing protein [Mycobacteroides abscessus]|uniref:DUF4333 domain-containing protein n=2 Tax=Mycobacteroides abscessus TaxID=36809 RepID=UPI00194EEA93|nr:DUF4333 domain-containing protein [Mycobacteroides abscessus]MDO3339925.1 DUF4333 domain-containing protein [Mycobacteroides abscessus subsp. abscessus]